MASIFDWSITPASNTTLDGINVNTGMSPANVDNAFRSAMAIIRQTFSATLQNFLSGASALGITSGGTGGTTAAAARLGLGCAKSGANSDITSLTAITGDFGYASGAGGTVTQATSKGTNVTLNTRCGAVTTSNSALGASAATAFTVFNSSVAATDTVIVHVKSGPASPGAYRVEVCQIAAGSFAIVIQNTSGGSLSEAIVINFSVIKAVAA